MRVRVLCCFSATQTIPSGPAAASAGVPGTRNAATTCFADGSKRTANPSAVVVHSEPPTAERKPGAVVTDRRLRQRSAPRIQPTKRRTVPPECDPERAARLREAGGISPDSVTHATPCSYAGRPLRPSRVRTPTPRHSRTRRSTCAGQFATGVRATMRRRRGSMRYSMFVTSLATHTEPAATTIGQIPRAIRMRATTRFASRVDPHQAAGAVDGDPDRAETGRRTARAGTGNDPCDRLRSGRGRHSAPQDGRSDRQNQGKTHRPSYTRPPHTVP